MGARMSETLQRREDWPERLADLIAARLHAPFSWGANDCALFAADAVRAVTGVDLADHFRGRYTDESGARQMGLNGASRHLATGDFEAALRDMASLYLDGEIAPALARRGDIVLIEHAAGYSLAVCDGAVAFAPGRRGLLPVPRVQWRAAWRVGRG